ncbi:hypothetical protein E2C01_011213 [Portunus trituberculatus]|uniref:Uncharacterized protein n=1 Tax=Portunus trituberculatus TaxID=210409 RepID=A0A5B7DAG9_PORTR|nr:hypothetical protein [Portunus trituberculatus]
MKHRGGGGEHKDSREPRVRLALLVSRHCVSHGAKYVESPPFIPSPCYSRLRVETERKGRRTLRI